MTMWPTVGALRVWRRNLEPLESFAAQGSQDGDAIRFEAFLGVADR